MEWYTKVVKDNYFNFDGRARRKEYWMFVLVNILILIALSIIEGMTGLMAAGGEVGILSSIYSLAVLLPALGVGVRRLHDTGKSGWWILISFVPLVGAIVLLIFFVFDSAPGENRFGPNPKGVVSAAPAPTPEAPPKPTEEPTPEEPTNN